MIPEETIVDSLNWLLGQAKPGDALHHLLVVSAGGPGPLGLPDPGKLETRGYSIAPVRAGGDQYVAKVIASAGVEHAAARRTVLFAALSRETWWVQSKAEETREDLRRLAAAGKLAEHPGACEVTRIYGACRDGRRWRGRRILTGPRAGVTEDVTLLVGRFDPQETDVVGGLVRRLVGLK